ncbi:unnamed protein product [Rangifer tarandus platyrhynchus]|uniref:Uncharacterized protein n=2 Tax=Rangifer tarandus platyrhynchus TaxID=3082113 RepID=A0AC59YEN3_RANTA|nr:unnamed protein product [Rangifer tarandus platyrhynchus]
MGFKSDSMVGTVDTQKGRRLGMMILGLDILNLKCPWHLQLKMPRSQFCMSIWSVAFPGCSVVKNLPANAGDPGSIPGSGRSPGEGNGNPLHYSCHGQRSLTGYSPWAYKESDMTEQLTQTHTV